VSLTLACFFRSHLSNIVRRTGEFVGKLQMAETFMWRAARWLALSALQFLVPADPTKPRLETDPNEGKNPMAWIQGMKVELEL
jgi:hypothetical protein